MSFAGRTSPARVQELWAAWNADKTDGNRNAVVTEMLPLIRYHAVGVGLKATIQWRELITDGVAGCVQAMPRYRPGPVSTFYHYAECRIRGSILDGCRQLNPYNMPRTGFTKIEPLDILSGTPDWSADDPETAGIQAERERAVRRAVAQLDAREQRVIWLLFRDGLYLREIADLYGLTESRICQIKNSALRKLRARLDPARVIDLRDSGEPWPPPSPTSNASANSTTRG